MISSFRTQALQYTLAAVFSLSGACLAASISVPADAATISEAVNRAQSGDTIWVSDGTYREHVVLNNDIVLIARTRFGARIDGGGRGTVLDLSKGNVVTGFEIVNGTIGIFSKGSNNIIKFNRIMRNWQTGIVVVRHLPAIEDNIIAFNGGSGIQGWDVRSSTASVNHNTIAYNGNHGLAAGGSSSFLVENNIIAFNERFGLRLHEETAKSIRVANNDFFQNLNQPGGVPQGNFSFDPAFLSPRRKLDFTLNPEKCCTIKGTDNENLGARLTF